MQHKDLHNTQKTYGIANSSSEVVFDSLLTFSQRAAVDISVWSSIFLYSSSYSIGRRLICDWRKPVFGWYPKTQFEHWITSAILSLRSDVTLTNRLDSIHLRLFSSYQLYLLCIKPTPSFLVFALSLWSLPWSLDKRENLFNVCRLASSAKAEGYCFPRVTRARCASCITDEPMSEWAPRNNGASFAANKGQQTRHHSAHVFRTSIKYMVRLVSRMFRGGETPRWWSGRIPNDFVPLPSRLDFRRSLGSGLRLFLSREVLLQNRQHFILFFEKEK